MASVFGEIWQLTNLTLSLIMNGCTLYVPFYITVYSGRWWLIFKVVFPVSPDSWPGREGHRCQFVFTLWVFSVLSVMVLTVKKWQGRSILWQRRPFSIPQTCFWPVFTLLNWSCDLASHLTTWSKMSTRSQSRKVKVAEGTTWTVEVNNIPGKYTT